MFFIGLLTHHLKFDVRAIHETLEIDIMNRAQNPQNIFGG